jgi:CubicO group peptidase (beta-lactamase class C family)
MSIGGWSKARLNRMHDVMAGYVDRGDVPGIVTLVSRHGEVQVDAIGMKTAGGRDPMRRDTIFRIASLTKPIAAAATMILVEECKLRLDEPVDRLLPELTARKVLNRLDGPLDDPAPDEWIRRLGTLPLMHQPGEKWMYHTASDVLGVLIARASGRPLETFLRERIFDPLGMKDTGFSVPATSVDRLATSYQVNPETGALQLYDETMTTDQLTPAQKAASGLVDGYFDSHGWGFGVSVVTKRHDVAGSVGTFGWDGGLGTSWRSDPTEDMVGILMTQRAWTSPNPPDVCLDFWTSAYQAITA